MVWPRARHSLEASLRGKRTRTVHFASFGRNYFVDGVFVRFWERLRTRFEPQPVERDASSHGSYDLAEVVDAGHVNH